MRHQTFNRLRKAWANIPTDHQFKDKDEFFETAFFLGEVSGNGSNFHYCPQRADEPVGPENMKLVEVQTDSDWNKVFHPAF